MMMLIRICYLESLSKSSTRFSCSYAQKVTKKSYISQRLKDVYKYICLSV